MRYMDDDNLMDSEILFPTVVRGIRQVDCHFLLYD